jgi:hypothetical protein
VENLAENGGKLSPLVAQAFAQLETHSHDQGQRGWIMITLQAAVSLWGLIAPALIFVGVYCAVMR